MDQDAFRALLNAPSEAGSSRRPTQPTRAGGRVTLGGGSRETESTSEHKSSGSLKPRKFKSKDKEDGQKKGKESESVYRDRASERRQGKEGDFAEAEHLLENFQARVAAAGDQVDRDLLEQQTKYLGGDEHHTILVKGLDHALLQRRKAELAEGGKLGQVTDDDLEAAFEETRRHEPDPPHLNARSSSHKLTHRDELLAKLKSSRTSVPADLVVVDQLKTAGKFKPIGSAPKTAIEIEEQERKERKKRKKERKLQKAAKLAAAEAKSKKSEQSKVENDQPTLAKDDANEHLSADHSVKPDAAAHTHQNISSLMEADPQPKSTIPPEVNPQTPARPLKPAGPTISPPAAEEVDDIDIFADVGEYKPFGDDFSDASDDGEPQNPSPPPIPDPISSTSNFKRKNYFEDDSDVDRDEGTSSKPDTKPEPILTSGSNSHRTQHTSKLASLEDEDQELDESGQPPVLMTKLQGLSGSADIKSLLAADAAQEKEEKRKAKKLKKSETVKVLTEKDKLNRDVMEMDRYLQKKNAGEKTSTS